jgi:hypothetical protein
LLEQLWRIESEVDGETSRSLESSTQLALKHSAPTHAPSVISSALGNFARWELLRAPNQMLRGGSRFLATAFVPKELKTVKLEARVRVELQKYRLHEISITKLIELARPRDR